MSHGKYCKLFRKRWLLLAGWLAFTIPTGVGAKETKPSYQNGPPPEWSHYKAAGEDAIRQLLVDPDSARFEWPRGYHQGGWKPDFEKRNFGYVTCGYVNARNRMGYARPRGRTTGFPHHAA